LKHILNTGIFKQSRCSILKNPEALLIWQVLKPKSFLVVVSLAHKKVIY